MQSLFAQVQAQAPAQGMPDYTTILVGSPLAIVGNIFGLVALICYILVIVKMFQNGQTGLGIGCLLGFCVCGIGYFIAFVYGWMKARDWNLQTVMLIWTVALVINIALGGYVYSTQQVVVVPQR